MSDVTSDAAAAGAAAFFVPGPDGFTPTPVARSPWSAAMLHGRLLTALAGREVERHHLDGDFAMVRLTSDLFRSPKMEPVAVRAERVRDGNRVRAVDVTLSSGGHDVARASALLLRQTAPEPADIWSAPAWSAPAPDAVPPRPGGPDMGWEVRWFSLDEGPPPRRGMWIRDPLPLVQGEPLTPLGRVVLAVDAANPVANNGVAGLQFINADLTLSLIRPPRSEWIGLETVLHEHGDGLAIGACDVHDAEGRIGHAVVTGVANRREA